MKCRLVVYGLLGMALAIVLSTQYTVDRPDAEMVVIVNPINPLNPVVKNPYQTEYEQMLYPTVRITAGYSTGSGVIISTTDEHSRDRDSEHRWTQIITAAHVVEDQSVVDIELYNSEIVTGTVVIIDTDKDLALIRTQIDADFRIYGANLAPQDYTYYLFTPVYAVGCSLGLSPRPSSGILSALSASVVEISAPVLPGNSGGPVYDSRTYEVIGIAVWVKVCQGQLVTTMGGIVPIQEVYRFLDDYENLSESGDAGR